jgi:hypothetical protein
MNMIRRLFISTILLCLSIFLAGCSSYKPVRQAETRTIALAPILNESDVPQIIAPISRNLREALNHSADWRIVDPEAADVLLQITVLQRQRSAISRDPDDTGRPLSYYEELTVSVSWESDLPPPWGNEPVTTVSANTILYSQPSLAVAESAVMGKLADDIAQKILLKLNWPASAGQQ